MGMGREAKDNISTKRVGRRETSPEKPPTLVGLALWTEAAMEGLQERRVFN
jgi:hypothetical protein